MLNMERATMARLQLPAAMPIFKCRACGESFMPMPSLILTPDQIIDNALLQFEQAHPTAIHRCDVHLENEATHGLADLIGWRVGVIKP